MMFSLNSGSQSTVMGKEDKRIDQYILSSADFAQPILLHLRRLVHEACPHVSETMKWSFPHFEYSGEILCNMAAFKNHCSFGFWKASLLSDPHRVLQLVGKTAMGSFGQIRSLKDLPSNKIIKSYIKEAAKLNEQGVKTSAREKAVKKALTVPPDLEAALKKKAAVRKTFENFSPSHRNEYIEWINEAKTETTRNKRIQTTVEWVSEGKSRNWKYMK